jgi:hypothetical protein
MSFHAKVRWVDITHNLYHNIDRLCRQPGRNGSPAGTSTEQVHEPSNDIPVDRITLSAAAKTGMLAGPAIEKAIKSEQDLSNEQRQVVNDLKKRDLEVKAHEQAHIAAGGPVVQSGATYQYQTGPDGKMYAVGGEVKIDVSPERTPDATIRKMQQVRRAALAPAQPSSSDRAVAAQASQIEAQARMEKNSAAQSRGGVNWLMDSQTPVGPNTDVANRYQPNSTGMHIDMLA